MLMIFGGCATSGIPVALSSVAQFETFIDGHSHALLGVFSACDSECDSFRAACNRTSLQCAEAVGEHARAVLDDVEGAPSPVSEDHTTEVLLFAGWDNPPHAYRGAWLTGALVAFTRHTRFPAVQPLTRETHRAVVRESGRATLWVFGELEGVEVG